MNKKIIIKRKQIKQQSQEDKSSIKPIKSEKKSGVPIKTGPRKNLFIDPGVVPHDNSLIYDKLPTTRNREDKPKETPCTICGKKFIISPIYIRDGLYTCDSCLITNRGAMRG